MTALKLSRLKIINMATIKTAEARMNHTGRKPDATLKAWMIPFRKNVF